MPRGSIGAWVNDLDTALFLRSQRLLTSSLRYEPTFKHEEVDDPDFDPESYCRGSDTKKARKVASFNFAKLLPLHLSEDEANLALALGVIAVHEKEASLVPVDARAPSDPGQDGDRLALFRAMHSLGWTMVDGLKFGVDYLAYVGDPLRTHADLMVLFAPLGEQVSRSILDATLLTTVAAKTRKALMFASRDTSSGKVLFTKLCRQPVNLPRFAGRGAPTAEDRLLDEVPEPSEAVVVAPPI
jgi:tRNA splicing endonuclease